MRTKKWKQDGIGTTLVWLSGDCRLELTKLKTWWRFTYVTGFDAVLLKGTAPLSSDQEDLQTQLLGYFGAGFNEMDLYIRPSKVKKPSWAKTWKILAE